LSALTIYDIENKIVSYLNTQITNAKIDICVTPEYYLTDLTPTQLPLCLISYSNNLFEEGLSYGKIFFNIFFITDKTSRVRQTALFDLMDDVYTYLNFYRVDPSMNDPMRFTEQSLYNESSDFIMYKQSYETGHIL
jgi:hypothetical protein